MSFEFKKEAVHLTLIDHDPLGLMRPGSPTGGYVSELQTIMPRLELCAGPEEASAVVEQEFRSWSAVVPEYVDFNILGDAVWSAYQDE